MQRWHLRIDANGKRTVDMFDDQTERLLRAPYGWNFAARSKTGRHDSSWRTNEVTSGVSLGTAVVPGQGRTPPDLFGPGSQPFSRHGKHHHICTRAWAAPEAVVGMSAYWLRSMMTFDV